MARLQILQLPEGAGDERPPFILVVDQMPADDKKHDALRRDLVDNDITSRTGARAALCFEGTIEIPANEPLPLTEVFDDAEHAGATQAELDEARQWARHGYEIGQKHCGWTDHGVAPKWLTVDWPPSFGVCDHLKRAVEYDEALTRVRGLAERPDIMDAKHPEPNGYLHGYRDAIRDAKRVTRSERAQAAEDGD